MSLLARRRAMMGAKKGFVHGTWEDLFRAIDEGTYATEYAVGEVLPLDLGSTYGNVGAEIVGFNVDTISDSTDKAPVTFVTKYLLKAKYKWNPTKSGTTEGTGTIGGWRKSQIRTNIHALKSIIPSIVRSRIVSVQKYSRIYDTTETAINNDLTDDELWIPSSRELGLVSGSSRETLGVVSYTGLNTNEKRIKQTPGDAAETYFTRSAYDTTSVWGCATTGKTNSTLAANSSKSFRTSIGFCVG